MWPRSLLSIAKSIQKERNETGMHYDAQLTFSQYKVNYFVVIEANNMHVHLDKNRNHLGK